MNSGSAMVGDGEEGYPPSMAGESIREAAAHAATPYEAKLSELLRQVAAGTVPVDEATRELRNLPFADLGFAKVDHHRELRQGQCEIVLAEGKSPSQVGAIVAQLVEGNVGPILVSRAGSAHREAVRTVGLAAGLQVDEWLRAQAVALRRGVSLPTGTALIVTAGTSDLPVAEEALLTAELMGAGVELVADVGVAGLHRLGAVRERLAAADAIVVVAGMEGALASVVGGMATCPVIACPTSVGYGSTFGGLAALLAMLSSCTPGVVCVGIDDGIGAGYAAALIARGGHA
jgi:pyridinium-3,5-biscarboxylic acid mononucleotide synthase